MDLKKKPAPLYIPIDPTYTKKIKSIFEGKSIMKFQERMKRFFFPAPDSPRWILLLPYITLIVVGLLIAFGGIHTWEYTNSNEFCGTACHTMPPQSIVFEESPHSNVTCEECHIGRASFFDQAMRKTQGLKEAYYQIFNLYEYPIRAKALRPSVETCEKCHRPETFADDSLRLFHRFEDDSLNTATTEYIIMKTAEAMPAPEKRRESTGISQTRSCTIPPTNWDRKSLMCAFTTMMARTRNMLTLNPGSDRTALTKAISNQWTASLVTTGSLMNSCSRRMLLTLQCRAV
jgi:hypothetical protein